MPPNEQDNPEDMLLPPSDGAGTSSVAQPRLDLVGRILGIFSQPHRKQIAANSIWLASWRVGQMLAGLIVGIWVARYLGPERYGIINYGMQLAALFGILSTFGMDTIIIREILDKPAQENLIMGTSLMIRLVGAVAATILGTATVTALYHGDTALRDVTVIFSFAVLLQSFNVIDLWFQSRVMSKYTVLAGLVVIVLISAVRVYLVLKQAPVEAFAWAGAIEAGCTAAGLAVVYRLRKQRLLHWRATWGMTRHLLKESFAMAISQLTVVVFMRLSALMLGYLCDLKEVGIYASAQRLVGIWDFLPAVLLGSVYPMMIKSRQAGEDVFRRNCLKLFSIFMIGSLVFAVPVSLFAYPLITLFFGAKFAQGYAALVFMSFACVFTWSGSVRAQILIINRQPIYHTYSAIAGIIVLVPANFLLIKVLGLGSAGAAISTLICYAVSAFGTSFMFKRLRYIGWLQLESVVYWIKPLRQVLGWRRDAKRD